MFEVQLQGKFKEAPKGEMFVGAQISKPLNLSLAMKSFSNLTLRFLNTLVSDLHVSYGDKQENNPNYELAHLVAPLFSSFDKVIITPPGCTPPPLFIPFYEDTNLRKKRCRYRSMKDHQIDINSTYSLSVNTGNLDLINWKIVNIPLARPMSLSNFFGNSSIELCGYELPLPYVEKHGSKKHPYNQLRQIFGMRLIHVGTNDFVPLSKRITPATPSISNTALTSNPPTSADEETEIEEIIEDELSSGSEDELKSAEPTSIKEIPKKKKVSWIRRVFNKRTRIIRNESDSEDSSEDSECDLFNDFDYNFEAFEDLEHCPAVIEINYSKKRNKRTHCYVLPYGKNVRLRSFWEIEKKIDLVQLNKNLKDFNFSSCELKRKQVSETLRYVRNHNGSSASNAKSINGSSIVTSTSSTTLTTLNSFLNHQNFIDLSFLTSNTIANYKSKIICEGHLAIALSRRYFSEQFAVLTVQSLTLRSRSNSKINNYTILLTDILSVQILDDAEAPFPGYSFFQIDTLNRVYVFLTHDLEHTTIWIDSFTHIIGNSVILSPLSSKEDYLSSRKKNDFSSNSDYLSLHIPSFRVDKENIMNFRRIQFKDGKIGNIVLARDTKSQQQLLRANKNIQILKPNQLIEKILSILLQFSQIVINTGSFNNIPEYDFIQFNDLISLLQVVDIFSLTDCEKLAFFLNLYHVMLLHGNLMLRFPRNDYRNYWPMFFNEVCYIVGFQILSLAEVEHSILRLHMNYASPYANITRPLGNSKKKEKRFKHFAISSRDFRLHFAINCGASTNVPYTTIYTPDNIDDQLDFIVKKDLESRFHVDENSRSISMPYLPFADFISYKSKLLPNSLPSAFYHESPLNSVSHHINKISSNHNHTSTSYLVEVLLVLIPYLSHLKQAAVINLLKDPSNINVDFSPKKLEDFRLLQKLECII